MGVFNSNKIIPVAVADLSPVANEVMSNFRSKGYDVQGEPTPTSGWSIGIRKGGIFKTVLGLKTALKIEIEPMLNGVQVTASIGIFGQQAVPTAIMLFLFWPIIVTQIWGLAQQANMDDEAIAIVETALRRIGSACSAPPPSYSHHAPSPLTARTPGSAFCVNCGSAMSPTARFCANCGTKV